MLRPIMLALAAVALAVPVSAQETAPTVTAPPIQFTEWKLGNGLTVIAIPDPTTSNVMTSVWYDVGSKNDPEGRSGFAHLFEHILSRKTATMPYNRINRLTEEIGAKPPRLDQSHRHFTKNGDHQAGQAGSGADVAPASLASGQSEQLGAIEDVASPQFGDAIGGN